MIRILRTALHRLARKPLRGIMTPLSFSLSAAILAVLACLVFQISEYLVENVEAKVCGQCGDKYFHAKTLEAIDQLLQGDLQVSVLMNVEVVTMN